MTETAPNKAQEARRRLLAALGAQQSQIDTLRQSNSALRHAVALIAQAAGITNHPVIAALGVKTADADNPAQPVPSPAAEAPAETTPGARKPDATADVETPGGVDGANTGVPPEGTADVTQPGGVMPAPEPFDKQDVTKPVSGTDTVPSPAEAKVPFDIQAPAPPEPDKSMFGVPGDANSGWTASAQPENGQHRLFKSMVLARLRKQAGIEDAGVDDLALGQQIHDSAATDEALDVETATLSSLVNRQASGQAAPVSRSLVPRAAAAVPRSVPSLAPQGDPGIYATASSDTAITEDEIGFAG